MEAAGQSMGEVLSPATLEELKGLGGAAGTVGAHLAAAAILLPDDPQEAQRHVKRAREIAPRSASTREAYGLVAYHLGDFAEAVKELRAARRISGSDEVLPLIADCERALGRPEKALDIAERPPKLSRQSQLELLLVAAGARIDLGQPEAAAVSLRVPLLDSTEQSEESARLKYVYAETLLASGDRDGAATWFRRAASADSDSVTDAADRAREITEGAP